MEQIKEFLIAKLNKSGQEVTDDDIYDLLCANRIHSEIIDERKSWNDLFSVAKIDGKLIGYRDAEGFGSYTPAEAGWQFNITSISEVIETEKVIKSYVKK